MKLILTPLFFMFGWFLAGCAPEPTIPDPQPVIFPTFSTALIDRKQNLDINVYPMRAEGNTTVYILKEQDYQAWKLKSLTDTKDFNSLLDSINYFNTEVKKKEAEYNR